MLKVCPYSGVQFKPRRRDQVYASPINRMRYHNDIAAEIRRIKAPVDKILEKNFIILSGLVKEGETKTFEKSFLIEKGYNTYFITHFDSYNEELAMCLYHFMILKTNNPNALTIINTNKND